MNISYHPEFQLGGACCDTSKIYNPFKVMTIQSKIIDINTGQPIENVNIYYKNNPKIGTTTNAQGEFSLEATVDEIITISHVSYDTIELQAKDILPTEYLEDASNVLDAVDLGVIPKKQLAGFGIWATILLVGLYLGTRTSKHVKAEV